MVTRREPTAYVLSSLTFGLRQINKLLGQLAQRHLNKYASARADLPSARLQVRYLLIRKQCNDHSDTTTLSLIRDLISLVLLIYKTMVFVALGARGMGAKGRTWVRYRSRPAAD
ncbi:hypothetical protein EVAR_36259_1 [Eumeta japonica]|uniref:Uncharacterized protein n=1 Tax=Eumeta variegata TaxID=151549 RepID=A0A4C1WVI5_EUMVA|nr:hypothetical protein EVAR_36259_1 [Eumeta japonica]